MAWTRLNEFTITDGAYIIRRAYYLSSLKVVYSLMQIDPADTTGMADYLPISQHASMGQAKKACTAYKKEQAK